MRAEKIDSLQTLRGFAALLVVFHHSKDFAQKYGHENWLTDFLGSGIGAFGVDIFFVLSGFIMFHTTRDATSARIFLANRIARVAPMYWIVTSILAILLILTPGLFSTMRFEPWHYLKSILFIPHNSPSGDYLPLLGVGWTLCFEMYFYLAFASLIKVRSYALALLSGYFAIMVTIGLILPPHENRLLWTLTSTLNLEFAFGIALAHIILKIPKIPTLGVLLSATGFLAAYLVKDLGGPHVLRGITWGLPATLIMYGFLMMSNIRFHRAFTVLGDSSYSLYLIHMLSLPFLWKMAHLSNIQLESTFLIAAFIFISVAASVVAWIHIERPASKAAKQLLLPKKPAALARS